MDNASPLRAILVTCMMCTVAACSRDASTAQPGTSAQSASDASRTIAAAASGRDAPANPCDRAIAAADMAGILIAPAARDAGPDAATCVYRTQTKANVTISVARGDAAKGAWTLATKYSGTKNPLPGIGDEALYNPEGTTLIARKGDTSCRLDVVGFDNADAMDDITKARGEDLARKLGALCNKMFAANS